MSTGSIKNPRAESPNYRSAWVFVFVAQFFIIALYFETFKSIVNVWLQSETFLHGFLIPLISAFLIWQKRATLRKFQPEPCFAGLLALALLSAAWLVADRLAIQVGVHFVVVAMLPAALLSILGSRLAREMAFPLGYLVFAVPFGEILIPYLIDFTAWFTIEALQITGIPVVRDGRFFAIPSGNFEVARACSGIRYLLATLALGTLYGYIIFSSVRKRLIFFAISIVVPIVANGLRAYLIVLLAHLSDMRIAAGVDHVIYGWIFFGFVIAVLFLIGARFDDGRDKESSRRVRISAGRIVPEYSRVALVLMLVATVAAASPGRLVQRHADSIPASQDHSSTTTFPASLNKWIGSTEFPEIWAPSFSGWKQMESATYQQGNRVVHVSLFFYGLQRQGAEAANEMNHVVDTSAGWRIGNTRRVELSLPSGGSIRVSEYVVSMGQLQGIVWTWYNVGGWQTASRLRVKFYEAMLLLMNKNIESSVTVIATPMDTGLEASRQALENFALEWITQSTQCAESGAVDAMCSTGHENQRDN